MTTAPAPRPSGMVADLLFPVRCIECKRRHATRAAGKSGRIGTELCGQCWREEFTDPRGEE